MKVPSPERRLLSAVDQPSLEAAFRRDNGETCVPKATAANIIGILLFVVFIGGALHSVGFWGVRPTGYVGPRHLEEENLSMVCSQRRMRNRLPDVMGSFRGSDDDHNKKKIFFVPDVDSFHGKLGAIATALSCAYDRHVEVEIVAPDLVEWMDTSFSEPKLPFGCFPDDSVDASQSSCEVIIVNSGKELESLMDQPQVWRHLEHSDELTLCVSMDEISMEDSKKSEWFFRLLRV